MYAEGLVRLVQFGGVYCAHCTCSLFLKVVYYEWRKRELQRRLINEGRCDERLKDSKIKLRNLHASHTLGCTTKQTRNT